jgi:prepilin-type N-terminal cleavage/methylation domain-containing protein
MKKNTFKGFTLIEVLITLVIIAVLVGITVVALNPGDKINTAHDTKIKADITQLVNAVSLYRNEHGSYPFVTSGSDIGSASAPVELTDANDGTFCNLIVDTNRILGQLPINPRDSTAFFKDCTDSSSGGFELGYLIYFDAAPTPIVTISAELSDGETYKLTR